MLEEKGSSKKRKSIGDYFHLLSVPAGILLLAMVAIDVCGRAIFAKSFVFGLTLEQLLSMVIAFASLGATWKAGQFISIDFFVILFRKRVQLVFLLISIFVSIVCSVILMWFGLEATIRAFVGGARPMNMNMPLGIWKLFIPVTLAVLIVEMITSLLFTIKQLISEKAKSEDE
jgi:TRAP-type C4-dicarboxylate transport system permease small subunit